MPGRGVGFGQPGDQVLGASHAAVTDRPLRARRPALGDGRAGKVRDGVAPRERLGGGGLLQGIPPVGLDLAERVLGAHGFAAQDRDLDPGALQLGDEPAADQAARA